MPPKRKAVSASAFAPAPAPEYVQINVNGFYFDTTRSTIARAPAGRFARLLDDDGAMVRDEDDRVFVDRAHDVFGLMLEYARSQGASATVLVPPDANRALVERELVYWFTVPPRPVTAAELALSMDTRTNAFVLFFHNVLVPRLLAHERKDDADATADNEPRVVEFARRLVVQWRFERERPVVDGSVFERGVVMSVWAAAPAVTPSATACVNETLWFLHRAARSVDAERAAYERVLGTALGAHRAELVYDARHHTQNIVHGDGAAVLQLHFGRGRLFDALKEAGGGGDDDSDDTDVSDDDDDNVDATTKGQSNDERDGE